MTTVTIFSAVVLIVLFVGTIAIVRLDVRKAAGRTVAPPPRRASWFVGSRAFIPVACLGAVTVVGAIGAIGSRVTLGGLQQEARNTQEAVVTAVRRSTADDLSSEVVEYAPATSALVRLESKRERLAARVGNVGNSTDRDVRKACVQFLSSATGRLTRDPNARLQRSESRLIEYCLPKLQAEGESPATAPRRVNSEAIRVAPSANPPTAATPAPATVPTTTK